MGNLFVSFGMPVRFPVELKTGRATSCGNRGLGNTQLHRAGEGRVVGVNPSGFAPAAGLPGRTPACFWWFYRRLLGKGNELCKVEPSVSGRGMGVARQRVADGSKKRRYL
jgi:hypothetical protein